MALTLYAFLILPLVNSSQLTWPTSNEFQKSHLSQAGIFKTTMYGLLTD